MWDDGHFAGVAEPSIELYEEVEVLLNAHPNWDFAGEVLSGSYYYQTWRCIGEEDAGAGIPGNGFGEDFYLTFRYHENGESQHFRIGAFEEYFHAQAEVARPCVNLTNNNTAPDPDGSFGGGTQYAITNGNNVFKHEVQVSEIMDYWILVANDGVYVGSRIGTSDWGVYAGLFESLMEADPFPLVVSNIISTSQHNTSTSDAHNANRGYWSRHPNVTVSNVRCFKVSFPQYQIWTRRSGQIGNIGDPFHNGRVLGSRLLVTVVGMSDGSSDINDFGNIRGLWNHLLYFNVPSGVAAGDTINIDGDIYHYCGGSAHIWINRDAE